MPCVGEIPGASTHNGQDRIAERWITTVMRAQSLSAIITEI